MLFNRVVHRQYEHLSPEADKNQTYGRQNARDGFDDGPALQRRQGAEGWQCDLGERQSDDGGGGGEAARRRGVARTNWAGPTAGSCGDPGCTGPPVPSSRRRQLRVQPARYGADARGCPSLHVRPLIVRLHGPLARHGPPLARSHGRLMQALHGRRLPDLPPPQGWCRC